MSVDYLALEGISARSGTVRWDLLDQDLNVVGELHPDSAKDQPRMTNDGSRAIKRSCSGVVLPRDQWTAFNIPAARVKPQFVISGDPNSPYPLGVFLFGDAPRRIGTGYEDLHADLDDQGVILDQAIRRSFSVNQGSLITDGMQAIIDLFPVTFTIVGSAATFGAPNAWPPDTLGSRVLADMCDAAGYLPAYFDNDGIGRLRPAGPIDSLTPDHTYGPDTIVIADTPLESDQILSSPNVFLVTANGGADNAISGEYILPSTAPNSIANRGFAIVDSSTPAGVTDSAGARQAAEALASAPDSGYRQLNFTTTPNPTHDTFDLISWGGALYRELSWTLELAEGGAHEHSCTRLDGATP